MGITQKEVADDLGISVKAVSHFENGRSTNAHIFMWYVLKCAEVEHGKVQSLEGMEHERSAGSIAESDLFDEREGIEICGDEDFGCCE